MLTFAALWSFVTGAGGAFLAGLAAVAAVGVWGWQRERKGRHIAQTEAERDRERSKAHAAKTRLDVGHETDKLGPDGVRDALKQWVRDDTGRNSS